MIDYKTTLVSSLTAATGLNVYYELFLDSNIATPCITYIQTNDYGSIDSSTIRYSQPTFQIKLWGDTTNMATLSTYIGQIDDTMWGLGFHRTAYNELTYDNHIQFIFSYTALVREEYP